MSSTIYGERKLAQGHPDNYTLDLEGYVRSVSARPDDRPRIERMLTYMGRLIDLTRVRNVLVLGCGPLPAPIKILREKGFHAVGVEPVQSFVDKAREFLGQDAEVLTGVAEKIPLPDESQDIVFFESVLEHVDSPFLALREIHRVTAPGGLLFVVTTNRYRVSPTGYNAEFNIPFYNWFPRLVQESYVFQHLHYRPHLANRVSRPAVHWWSYADLCAAGRTAGFAQFYSPLDLVRETDQVIARSAFRRLALRHLQRNAWLRALALRQVGDTIFMWKRP